MIPADYALPRMIRKLQFHYWLSDRTHTMDALVLNKCERELLEITRTVARICKVSLIMETEPSGKGGLKSWLNLLPKTPRKTDPVRLTLVNALVASSILTLPKASTGPVLNRLLESLLAEAEETDRAGLDQWIQQIKERAVNILPLVDQNRVLKKRRSNLFSLLSKYPKVKGFSVALTNESRKPVSEDQLLLRENFQYYKVVTDTVAPELVEQAQIEIISPVLVKGRHKWKGLYQQAPISFVMKSDDFMELVQSGKVEFKSGSTITCTLEIEKKMTVTGELRVTGYTILSVSRYSENGKTLEMPEEKPRQKQAPAVSKRQLDLFG
jgi:hypothetical protein